MTRHDRMVALAAAVAIAGAPLAAGSATAASTPVQSPITTSTAGINRAVLLPVPSDPSVSFKIAFRVGSQDDPPGKERSRGAHRAAHGRRGHEAAHLLGDPRACSIPWPPATACASTRRSPPSRVACTRTTSTSTSGLLLDAIREPAFSEADFQRLKQRAKDFIEKTLRYSSDEELGKQTLYAAMFAGTPYEHLNAGTVAGLDAITLDDVRAFYNQHFTRDAAILAVGAATTPSSSSA